MITDQLPPAVVESWDWQTQALCRGRPNLFFAPDGERSPQRHQRELAAKRVCDHCPVQITCQQHALAVNEPYGLWGGLSESERGIPRGSRS